MQYSSVVSAVFVKRVNRFVAHVLLDSALEVVHVKNTGRCAELLAPGCTVWLAPGTGASRKTKYDLVAAEKGNMLINMDSMAPNTATKEWLLQGGLYPFSLLKPEYTLGNSRFDFYGESPFGRHLIEVKGCTLENDGIACFPDAPTLRGLKHVQELTHYAQEGWLCTVLIVIQMKPVRFFRPNWATQPAFGHALREAAAAGVDIKAMDCIVAPGHVSIDSPVPISLDIP